MPENAEQVEIARIPKSKTVSIVFSIVNHEGNYYIDMREYVTSANFTGFTKKGYRFDKKHLSNILEKLNEISGFINKPDWQEYLNKLRQNQLMRNNKEEVKTDDLTRYLHGVLDRDVSPEELLEWINLCYKNHRYSDGIKLFDLIAKDSIPDEIYTKIRKLADTCKVKMG